MEKFLRKNWRVCVMAAALIIMTVGATIVSIKFSHDRAAEIADSVLIETDDEADDTDEDFVYIPKTISLVGESELSQVIKDRGCDINISYVGDIASNGVVKEVSGLKSGSYFDYTVTVHDDVDPSSMRMTAYSEDAMPGRNFIKIDDDTWIEEELAVCVPGETYEVITCFDCGLDAQFNFINTAGIITIIEVL